jgi:hypothetical protein
MLHDLISEAAERRGIELGSDFGPARESYLREFEGLYRDWLESAREAQTVLAALEAEGYKIEASARFNEAVDDVGRITRFSVEGLIRSLRSMARGDRLRRSGMSYAIVPEDELTSICQNAKSRKP